MFSTFLCLTLVFAPLMGQISTQTLNATFGKSVMFPCLLSNQPVNVTWSYWKEQKSLMCHWKEGKIIKEDSSYVNRTVCSSELSSGNVSLTLNDVAVGDDLKIFWVVSKFTDQQKKVKYGENCKFMLQVSAPYRDLELKINKTEMRATCKAYAGYPKSNMSWRGLKKTSSVWQDLEDAEMSLLEDPTNKTFTVTSSASVKGLQSVNCSIYDQNSNETKSIAAEVDPPDWKQGLWAILGIALLIPLGILIWYRCGNRQQQTDTPGRDTELVGLRSRHQLNGSNGK